MKNRLLKPALLLSASAVLLLLSTVGSTRAALTYYSENYAVEVTVSSIGVSLLENGEMVSYRNYDKDKWNEGGGELLAHMLEEGEELTPGKSYEEVLAVANSGAIDSYVRVILNKSWLDSEGKVDTTLSPDLVDLNLQLGNGWIEDEAASTSERTVLYYTGILPSGQSTPAFSDTLKVNPEITAKVTEEITTDAKGYQTITTTYTYDDYRFQLDAEVDAVQTHNAQDAIKSAWGIDVDIAADGSLSLR